MPVDLDHTLPELGGREHQQFTRTPRRLLPARPFVLRTLFVSAHISSNPTKEDKLWVVGGQIISTIPTKHHGWESLSSLDIVDLRCVAAFVSETRKYIPFVQEGTYKVQGRPLREKKKRLACARGG